MMTNWKKYFSKDFIYEKHIHVLFALASAQLISAIMMVMMKYSVHYVPPPVFAAFRSILAAPTLLVLSQTVEKTLPPTKKDYAILFGLGLLGITFNQLFVLSALHFTTATNAVLLSPANPVFATAFSIILKREKATWFKIAAILCAIAGTCVMVGVDKLTSIANSGELFGNCLLLGSALSFSSYMVAQKIYAPKFPYPITIAAFAFLFGGIVVILFSTYWWGQMLESVSDWPMSVWFFILYSGVIGSAINYWITGWTIKKTSVAVVSIFMCLQPLFGAILASIFLHESLSIRHAIGAPIIVGGLLIVAYGQSKEVRIMKNKSYTNLKEQMNEAEREFQDHEMTPIDEEFSANDSAVLEEDSTESNFQEVPVFSSAPAKSHHRNFSPRASKDLVADEESNFQS